MPDTCPCASGMSYALCCGSLHQGLRQAESAEQLMRSRYAAFALGLDDYLAASWHPQTRPDGPITGPVKWLGLEIIDCRLGGPEDSQGEVAFRARYLDGDRLEEVAENSRFTRLDGHWVYVDGERLAASRPERRIGRNEPCPCGSGAKFKRCCGK